MIEDAMTKAGPGAHAGTGGDTPEKPAESPLPADRTLAAESPLPADRTLAAESPLPADRTLAAESPLPADRTLAAESPPAAPQLHEVAGAARMPVKYIYAMVAVAVAMLLVLVLVDRMLSSTVTPVTTAEPATLANPGAHVGHAAPISARSLTAPLSAFLGIHALGGHRAPRFSLTDAATGAGVSLGSLRGHVVVLTFANAACNDICPVLGAELAQASADLGTTHTPVTFLTVNSDPLDLHTRTAKILSAPGFAGLAHWRFLTGSIAALDPVWVHYGISITADALSGRSVHDDAMYFIDPGGTLKWSGTLWADQSESGTYRLPAADISRFATAIAHYAGKLAAQP